MSADGTPQHVGDMAAQVELSLDNLEAVLDAAGMTLTNVVRLNMYTTPNPRCTTSGGGSMTLGPDGSSHTGGGKINVVKARSRP
jgi:Endoribonuclease L-PSP